MTSISKWSCYGNVKQLGCNFGKCSYAPGATSLALSRLRVITLYLSFFKDIYLKFILRKKQEYISRVLKLKLDRKQMFPQRRNCIAGLVTMHDSENACQISDKRRWFEVRFTEKSLARKKQFHFNFVYLQSLIISL